MTEQGLTLKSTVTGQPRERFALWADALGREGGNAVSLPRAGEVETGNGLARWLRPKVTEEYSVSVDGVRQDFVITERPEGDGPLRLELALSGTRAETASFGTRLTLDGSGRRLAYSRPKAWDAVGRELPSRMEATGPGRLRVVIEDAGAVWPVRIDPTLSDENWISMNSMRSVNALAIDGSGNLYAGGDFTTAGSVSANRIARWDGSTWSPLGSGMDNCAYEPTCHVDSLAIDNSGNLYAGGCFTTAGDVSVNNIAKWDGSAWSPVGTGMNNLVSALAIDGSGKLYAGGWFTNAGGLGANYIARWDGSAWSPLGSGMDAYVLSLTVDSSGCVYVGGAFTYAGEVKVNKVAKWNGSAWSPLGSGMDDKVYALACDNSGNLYAGGGFITAGGVGAHHIAKWNGSTWSPLGSGMFDKVLALAVDGSGNLYATGWDGSHEGNIYKWNGSA